MRDPFVVPEFPKKGRTKAVKRISAALDQLDLSVHLDLKGKRNTAKLYVGNLEFNASEQDLSKSLEPFFQWIKVEKINSQSTRPLELWFHQDIMGTSCTCQLPQ